MTKVRAIRGWDALLIVYQFATPNSDRERKSSEGRTLWKVSCALEWVSGHFYHFDDDFSMHFEMHEPQNPMKSTLPAMKFRDLLPNPDQEVLAIPDGQQSS